MSTPHVDRYTVVRQPDGRYSVVDMAHHVDVLVNKSRAAAHGLADELNAELPS